MTGPLAKKVKLSSTWGDDGACETDMIGFEWMPRKVGLGHTLIYWWKKKRCNNSYQWNCEFFPVKPLKGWHGLVHEKVEPWLLFSMKHPGVKVVPHKNLCKATDDEIELWLIASSHVHFVTHQKASLMILKWLFAGQQTKLIGTE